MFEKIVKSAYERISKDKEDTKLFYVLTHKKHRREIYFEYGYYEAINFMKMKFPWFFKRVIYYSLKLGITQPFLRIVRLPCDAGQLAFAAGQLKIFNFEKGEVISFPMPNEGTKEEFLKNKGAQKKMGGLGFAPKIYEINKKAFFSREELGNTLKGENHEKIFIRLIEYYNKIKKTKKVQSKGYIKNLRDGLEKNKINDKFIFKILSRLEKRPIELLTTLTHGDFAPGQILQKNGRILFVDWNPSVNLITEDMANFFRYETNLFSKRILNVARLYPDTVKKNLAYYLILSEIYNITIKPFYLKTAKQKIKKLLGHLS